MKFEKAKAYNLNKQIEYSDDSIVSKEIHNTEAGSVTLFAFDKNQGLSEHTAPFDALVQIIDGTGTIIIDGSEHQVNAGELIIMPANVPHAVKAYDKFKMLLTMIKK